MTHSKQKCSSHQTADHLSLFAHMMDGHCLRMWLRERCNLCTMGEARWQHNKMSRVKMGSSKEVIGVKTSSPKAREVAPRAGLSGQATVVACLWEVQHLIIRGIANQLSPKKAVQMILHLSLTWKSQHAGSRWSFSPGWCSKWNHHELIHNYQLGEQQNRHSVRTRRKLRLSANRQIQLGLSQWDVQ